MDYKKPDYCIKCGLCGKYKDCFQNLKVKDIGYGRSNIYCLKKKYFVYGL